MSAISGHAPGFSAFLRGVVATRNLGLVVVLSVLWKYNLPQKYNRKMPSILLGVLMSAPDGTFSKLAQAAHTGLGRQHK